MALLTTDNGQRTTDLAQRGVIALRAGRHEQAEPHFRHAIRKPGGRRDPKLYANLGATLGLKGDYRGAAAAYRQAIRLEPSARRYHELGTALALQGKFTEAEQAFESAVAIEPTALSWYSSRPPSAAWRNGTKRPNPAGRRSSSSRSSPRRSPPCRRSCVAPGKPATGGT